MATLRQLDRSGGTNFNIPAIVNMAESGQIRIPHFQRPFVWSDRDVRDLLDSIYRGFPIGTLLLWQQPGEAGTVTLGSTTLKVDAMPSAYWVVDGQQRITTLFSALSPIANDKDRTFDILFDLSTEKFISQRPGIVTPRAIPVRKAISTKELFKWIREHGDELEPEDHELAEKLVGAIRDYSIPAYVVLGDDRRLLREVFDRVNSAGKPISRSQVFHALFAGEKSTASADSVAESLQGLQFGRIEDNRILQSLLAVRGGDVQRDLHGEFGKGESPEEWYEATKAALEAAVGFLKSEGMLHLRLMPSTLPLPVLAAFFHLHPEPSDWSLRLLSRWLWRGWIHGFGQESGQTPILRRAIRSVNPQKGGADAAPSEYNALMLLLEQVRDEAPPELDLESFNTKNGSARLILSALAFLGPLDADRGEIDIALALDEFGNRAVAEIVPHRRRYAAARSFWRPTEPLSIAEVRDPSVLASHAINPAAAEFLEQGDVDQFLEIRGKHVRNTVANFLAVKLEHGALMRPPLSELGVADPARENYGA